MAGQTLQSPERNRRQYGPLAAACQVEGEIVADNPAMRRSE